MSADRRKRSNVRQYSAEDQALTNISKEAESRLAAKRAAREEAKAIRSKEIERRQKEAEEKERLGNDNTDTMTKARPPTTASSLSSRRGSDESNEGGGDVISKDRDKKIELRSLEEKYKAAMMSSAQLDNEKQSLVYQVELLKDQLEEQAESHTELQREYKEKNRELEMKKRELQAAQLELKSLREMNDYKDRLIAESGLMIVAAENGELAFERSGEPASSNGPIGTGGVLLSSEALDLLNKNAEGSLGTNSLASSSSASHTTHTTPSADPSLSASHTDATQPDSLDGFKSEDEKEQIKQSEDQGSSVDGPLFAGSASGVTGSSEGNSMGGDSARSDNASHSPDKHTDGSKLQDSEGRSESAVVGMLTSVHDDENQSSKDNGRTVSGEKDENGQADISRLDKETDEHSDIPTVVVTQCSRSHSQSVSSHNSEDEGDEFYDAVSTPVPSPIDPEHKKQSHFNMDGVVEIAGVSSGQSSTDPPKGEYTKEQGIEEESESKVDESGDESSVDAPTKGEQETDIADDSNDVSNVSNPSSEESIDSKCKDESATADMDITAVSSDNANDGDNKSDGNVVADQNVESASDVKEDRDDVNEKDKSLESEDIAIKEDGAEKVESEVEVAESEIKPEDSPQPSPADADILKEETRAIKEAGSDEMECEVKAAESEIKPEGSPQPSPADADFKKENAEAIKEAGADNMECEVEAAESEIKPEDGLLSQTLTEEGEQPSPADTEIKKEETEGIKEASADKMESELEAAESETKPEDSPQSHTLTEEGDHTSPADAELKKEETEAEINDDYQELKISEIVESKELLTAETNDEETLDQEVEKSQEPEEEAVSNEFEGEKEEISVEEKPTAIEEKPTAVEDGEKDAEKTKDGQTAGSEENPLTEEEEVSTQEGEETTKKKGEFQAAPAEETSATDEPQTSVPLTRMLSEGAASESSGAHLDDEGYDFDDIDEALTDDSPAKTGQEKSSIEITVTSADDAASFGSRDSGLQDSISNKEPEMGKEDTISIRSRDSVTIAEDDSVVAVGAVGGKAKKKGKAKESKKAKAKAAAASRESLDLEAKLDTLVSEESDAKDKHGGKKHKPFQMFKKIFK